MYNQSRDDVGQGYSFVLPLPTVCDIASISQRQPTDHKFARTTLLSPLPTIKTYRHCSIRSTLDERDAVGHSGYRPAIAANSLL